MCALKREVLQIIPNLNDSTQILYSMRPSGNATKTCLPSSSDWCYYNLKLRLSRAHSQFGTPQICRFPDVFSFLFFLNFSGIFSPFICAFYG